MRSELERELQQRLTDLFWKLSSDVIKNLMKHKVDVTSFEPQLSTASEVLDQDLT